MARGLSPGGLRLGINGWRIRGQRTGVGRYLHNVISRWTPEVVAGRFEEITLYTPRPLDRQEVSLPPTLSERVIGPDARMLVWENLRLGPVATDDVLFCPSYSRPLLARERTVVTTHEATARLHPELSSRSARLYARLYGWSARHASLVIAHTEAGRRDIVSAYGVPTERIRVVPPAAAEIFHPRPGDPRVEQARVRYAGTGAPFFLFVGKLAARRNVPRLIEGFGELKRRTALPHKLVVIGLNTTGLDVATLAGRSGVAGDVSHVPYVDDEDLSLLYSGAEAFVMPYSYESVSLTALEAQASGTPVIIGDAPGLREITGGVALLLARSEARDIAEALERLAGDAALRRQLGEQGRVHANRFSWQRSAVETLAVLSESTCGGERRRSSPTPPHRIVRPRGVCHDRSPR